MEDNNLEKNKSSWSIDLEWIQSSNRSFSAMTHHCLCERCRERLRIEEEEVPADEILAAINNCCSKEPNFITAGLPVFESIFRIFLANGNQPLNLKELDEQLVEWRAGNPYHASIDVLSRLLENDRYYGLRRFAD